MPRMASKMAPPLPWAWVSNICAPTTSQPSKNIFCWNLSWSYLGRQPPRKRFSNKTATNWAYLRSWSSLCKFSLSFTKTTKVSCSTHFSQSSFWWSMARMQRNRLRIFNRRKPWRASERASKSRERYSRVNFMRQENRAAWQPTGRTKVRVVKAWLHQSGERKQAAMSPIWVILRRKLK